MLINLKVIIDMKLFSKYNKFMEKIIRKFTALIITIFCYYLIHEGSHFLAAVIYGTFIEFRIIFPGIMVVTNSDIMTYSQIAVFSVIGPLSTILFGYIISLCANIVLKNNNKFILAIFYYVTIVLLVTDPIYITVLSGFFNGGDVNGIVLFGVNELTVKIIFGLIGCANMVLFFKYVYPKYKHKFKTL